MSPDQLLADHQSQPRHMGKLTDADLTGEVGSILIGDALRLYLRLTADDRIAEAHFQVFGAQDMLGSTSLLCDLLPGRSLDELAGLNVSRFCAWAGGLDPALLPLMPWGIEALHLALARRQGQSPVFDDEREALVCRCWGVSEAQIVAAIADGAQDLDALIAATGAGSGCGTCRQDLEEILQRQLGERERSARAQQTGRKGRLAQMAVMEDLLSDLRVAHDLAADAVTLWDWREHTVSLRATVSCPPVLRSALEDQLRAAIDPAVRVVIEPSPAN